MSDQRLDAALGRRQFVRWMTATAGMMAAAPLIAACAAPAAPAPAPTAKPAAPAPAAAPQPTAAPKPTEAPKPAAAAPTTAPAAAPTTAPAAAVKPTEAPKPAGGAKAKLTYLHLDDPALKPIRKSMVEDYNKSNGLGTVEDLVVAQDQLETKRNALFAAGTPPDISVGQGGSQNIAALKDILLDLGPYITRDPARVQIDQYYEKPLEYVKYKGKTLQWPCYPIVMVLAYNKELFDAAKVPYPTNDWTYDDLVKAAKSLTLKEGGKVKQWGVTIDRRSYIEWMNGIWARGGEIFADDLKKVRLNEKFGVDTFQWMMDKVYVHEMSPGPGQDIQGGFAGGAYAMDWGAHVASWPAFRKAGLKWDIVMLPKGPVARGPRIAMDTWSLAATSKSPDAAFDFLMFASSPEQASKLANAGFTPPRKDVAAATWLKDPAGKRANDPQNLEAYFESMPIVKHIQHSKFFLKVTIDIVAPHLDLMFEKKKTVEQAATDAAEEANKFLASQSDW